MQDPRSRGGQWNQKKKRFSEGGEGMKIPNVGSNFFMQIFIGKKKVKIDFLPRRMSSENEEI